MRLRPRWSTVRGMTSDTSLTVCVDRNQRGGWEVALPDQSERIRCETLDDARRIAYLRGAHRRPCELIIRDAYHRVLDCEHIESLNA